MTTRAGVRRSIVRGITRNVVALSVVSLLTDVSSEMLVFVVPLFLVNVIGASPAIVGVIEGVAESAGAILRLGSGALSDRLGRRRLLVGIGYGASTASKALYVVASTWPVVLVARLGDRVGKGIRTAPRDALIADSTPVQARGRAFGFHRAMDTLGAVIGVGVAAILVAVLQGDAPSLDEGTFRAIAVLALVPAVLGVAVVAVAVHDVPLRPAAEPVAPARAVDQPQGQAGPFPVAFWMFVAASGLFALGNSSDAFLVLRSQQLGIGVRDLLLLVIAFNLVGAVIAWPIGALSDRIGRRALVALAWGIYAVAYLGFALAGRIAGGDGAVIVAALWLMYGAYYGVAEAVGRALVADLAPAARRATAFGIVNALVAAMLLPASIVAGLLWSSVGPGGPFWFGAACAGAALVLLLMGVRPAGRTG
jgi:MFS family permease